MDPAQLTDLGIYIGRLFGMALPFIGLVSFIMILVGGFRILTAGADSKAVEGGKSTLTYAIAGIAMAIGAWLILSMIENITGSPVTKFNILFP